MGKNLNVGLIVLTVFVAFIFLLSVFNLKHSPEAVLKARIFLPLVC